MRQLLNKAGIFSLIILAISFLGCEDDDDANGLPEVVAAFIQTQIENTGVVSFTNISENADSFMWDFGDGTTSTEINPVKTFADGAFTVTLTASNAAGASSTFSDDLTIDLPDPPPPFDSGLLANGDFEDGATPWFTNFGDNIPEIREEGGNSFFFANVETPDPMQPFVVNLSQVVEITQGTNYILTFNASSDRERTILAGIGLNEAPFSSSSPEVTLTATTQTFTLQLAASDFGSANGRVLFDLAGAAGTVVLDNISLVEGGDGSDSDTGGGGTATEPTEAATTPTQDAANVISVFSNAYTDVAGTNTRAFGNDGGAVFSAVQVAGDDVWRYDNTDFVGIQNDTGFDLTGITNFSMDIWVAEDVSFRAGLISFTTPTSREDVEVNLTGGQWTTIDVAITDLVQSLGAEGPLPDDPTINQIIFDVLGVDVTANIFVDNVFFYTEVVATEPTVAAPTPTQDAANVTSVFSNAYTDAAGTNTRAFGNDGGAVFSAVQVAGDDVWRYNNTDFVGIQNDTGFDLTGRTNFSMDIWVAENNSFRAGLISFTTPTSREDVEVNLTGGQWTTIDVAISDLVPSAGSEGPLPDDPTINQIIFDVLGVDVTADIFVDNVFFYTAGGGGSSALVDETFDAATSIDSWIRAGDADTFSAEATLTFNAAEGNPDGTIELAGANTVTSAGRAYIFQNIFGGIDFSGVTDARLTFDARLGAPLTAAAIQLQTEIEGQGTVNTNDIQNQGINESTWTTITVDYTGISAGTGFFRFNVNIAAGAVVGAGTTLYIDNIRLEQTN
ncbi:PKD domain-containing protein [Flagellimonas meridianipacifica]|uniref:PKD domain-containing protein n=1 Tax=Flagellimonas meridianipacifica TaxID=1080225 RepID=A0A2T0MCW9_9FLAO|nr:PKD domain-containing protein [Allomuricauda pacifica]PRX55341.1 hypothetical protein CLV81_3750 [Allomuricauda pacifica]